MPQFDDARINKKLDKLQRDAAEHLIKDAAATQGIPYTDLHGITIDTEALRLVPEEQARAAELAVFMKKNKMLSAAVRNAEAPATQKVLDELQKKYHVELYVVSPESLEYAWERYKEVATTRPEKEGVLDISPDAVAEQSSTITSPEGVADSIRKLNASNSAERTSRTLEIVFGGALALGASDIHIEPEKTAVRLRYRLDGVLSDVTDIDQSIYSHITSRLKLLSGLTLNVHDEAQDGRFTFEAGDRAIEIRTSVIPGAYGESVVMRLLDPSASGFKIDDLRLNESLKKVIREELARPNGAILTTGPTGSGKTTVLYAFMREVHAPEKKIITIEDPVEYKLPGVVQTQVEDEYTFETGLRAILRQDPDVIMIGEIRDREVAETAMNAALTGHLVFSTLHTNSAAGAFSRLMDLGVSAETIGSAVHLVLSQRLVRKLCEQCRQPREMTTEEQKLVARILGSVPTTHTVYEPVGCEACNGSGYRGRVGVFEGIRVDSAVTEAILRDPREERIRKAAASQQIPSIQEDGVQMVLDGTTSLAELERVVDLYEMNTTLAPGSEDGDFASHIV